MDKMPEQCQYNDNENPLLDGMRHTEYPADAGDYMYQDAEWDYLQSARGSRYSQVTHIEHDLTGEDNDMQSFLPGPVAAPGPKVSWRHELMPLLNFGHLIGLVLLLLFWYLHAFASSSSSHGLDCPRGSILHSIHKGDDICWGGPENQRESEENIVKFNQSSKCDYLSICQSEVT